MSKQWHFYLCLAVIATTLFSWYNINAWCIIALVLCRLFDGGVIRVVRTAFGDLLFRAWAAIFLMDAVGLLYTRHFSDGWTYVESKATLVAIPLVICGGYFANREDLLRLWKGYTWLVFGCCCYCLAVAGVHFAVSQDYFLFFYHQLCAPLHLNAIFFSGYIMMAILFLLSAEGNDLRYRRPLIIFFTVIVVLLVSKLLMILLVVLFACYRKWLMAGFLSVVLIVCVLMLRESPIAIRYRQDLSPQSGIYNGISLRGFIWRSAGDIMNEHHAWVAGVSAGDSQHLLDEKFEAAGCPGYYKYNFHNEFIEVAVRSGLLGLGIFLVSCGVFVGLAVSAGDRSAWFTVIMVLLLFSTESPLETQHPAFFCVWFITLLRMKRS